MTIEELQAKIEELTGQITALKGNRDEILAEKKAEKAANKELRDQLAALSERLDETERKGQPKPKKPAARNDDDEEDDTDPRVLRAEMRKLQERLDAKEKEASSFAIETALSEQLAASNVAVPLRKAAAALFKTSHKLEASGRDVLVDGEPIADAVASWIAGEGAHFVAPPVNGGGAAPAGSGGMPSGKGRSKMSKEEKAQYVAKNGLDAYNRLPL